MISLRELAKKNNVSLATVSRALRNNPAVRPETRERILKSAEEFKYNPNNLVEGIIKGRTKLIAWISNNLGGGVSALIASAITDELRNQGWGLVTLNSHGTLEGEASCFQIALGMRVSGIALATVSYTRQPEHYRIINDHHIPYVVVNEYMPNEAVPHVHSDDLNSASLLIKKLMDLGHRKIAHIAGPEESLKHSLRFQGYMRAMSEARIKVRPEWIIPTDWSIENCRHAVRNLLNKNTEITALFPAQDILAAGVYRAAAECGLRIPADLSVVTMGGSLALQILHPEVTHVRQAFDQIGSSAIKVLMKLINLPKNSICPRDLLDITTPSLLMDGASIAPPKLQGYQRRKNRRNMS